MFKRDCRVGIAVLALKENYFLQWAKIHVLFFNNMVGIILLIFQQYGDVKYDLAK